MSTMSKPAVTPEMVEKAAGELEDTLHDLSGVHFDMLMDEAIKHKLQSLAASAVQDAVRECTPFLQHNRTCQFWDSWLGREIPCTCGLAAMREKYGVKP